MGINAGGEDGGELTFDNFMLRLMKSRNDLKAQEEAMRNQLVALDPDDGAMMNNLKEALSPEEDDDDTLLPPAFEFLAEFADDKSADNEAAGKPREVNSQEEDDGLMER